MKQFYATAQAYTRPFVTDTGVAKSGNDLRVVVATKRGKESVDAVVVEAISHDKGTKPAPPCIVVKVGPGVRVVPLGETADFTRKIRDALETARNLLAHAEVDIETSARRVKLSLAFEAMAELGWTER